MISYSSEKKSFIIETVNSTYVMTVAQKGYLAHTYYGQKINTKDDVSYLTRQMEYGFSDNKVFREKLTLLDFLPQEMPTSGLGDFRESALAITNQNGNNAVELKYKSYKIVDNTIKIPELPCVFDCDNCKSETLEILLEDEILGVEVTLFYTVFENLDAIIRSSKIYLKKGMPSVFIKKAFSLSFDMDNKNYDVITLHGSWARERHIDRHSIHMGKQGVESIRGETSHQEHPFLAILDHNADYNNGNVYGINFIYSGNFEATVQRNQFDSIRVLMGINDECFSWKLNADQSFYTPQAVLTFSNSGLNRMSHTFHDLYRDHLIRSPYKKSMRPILINNWEATYFNFNTQKLLEIAEEASKDGIEMLVMDDGWFSHRSFDDSSLGDWYVNEEKLPGGLNPLVEGVNKLGMKFGIWFEPEMISPNSDIYRAHPDYAIQISGREPGMGRQQLVMDITRKEVEDDCE